MVKKNPAYINTCLYVLRNNWYDIGQEGRPNNPIYLISNCKRKLRQFGIQVSEESVMEDLMAVLRRENRNANQNRSRQGKQEDKNIEKNGVFK